MIEVLLSKGEGLRVNGSTLVTSASGEFSAVTTPGAEFVVVYELSSKVYGEPAEITAHGLYFVHARDIPPEVIRPLARTEIQLESPLSVGPGEEPPTDESPKDDEDPKGESEPSDPQLPE